MMTITEFLLARIAEDEARAQAMWQEKVARRAVGQEVAYNWPTPDRTLAECEVKRRIVEHCDFDHLAKSPGDPYVLRLLALPYAGHPEYRDEWHPDATGGHE